MFGDGHGLWLAEIQGLHADGVVAASVSSGSFTGEWVAVPSVRPGAARRERFGVELIQGLEELFVHDLQQHAIGDSVQ